MEKEILIAIIGAVAMVLSAWIGSKRSRKGYSLNLKQEIINGNKANGDYIEGNKTEFILQSNKERKSLLVYWSEVIFTFVLNIILLPVLLGGIGLGLSGGEIDNPNGLIGAGIGALIGVLWALSITGNIKREKGIS